MFEEEYIEFIQEGNKQIISTASMDTIIANLCYDIIQGMVQKILLSGSRGGFPKPFLDLPSILAFCLWTSWQVVGLLSSTQFWWVAFSYSRKVPNTVLSLIVSEFCRYWRRGWQTTVRIWRQTKNLWRCWVNSLRKSAEIQITRKRKLHWFHFCEVCLLSWKVVPARKWIC